MSPILVRPVREQLEHDRVIRLLQAKYKRKFEVAINPGNEQTMPVGGTGASAWYPDLVLQNADRGHKLAGVVEVETTESVNNLEAMSQWATFARLRVPFHLYLPTASVDTARRFCADLSIPVAEMWAYQSVGDQLRFTLVQRAPGADGRESGKESRETRKATEIKAKEIKAKAERPARRSSRATSRPTGRARAQAQAQTSSRNSHPRPSRAAAARRAPEKTKAAAGRVATAKGARPKGRAAGAGRASKRR